MLEGTDECLVGVADEYEEEEIVDDEGDMMDVEDEGATAQVRDMGGDMRMWVYMQWERDG